MFQDVAVRCMPSTAHFAAVVICTHEKVPCLHSAAVLPWISEKSRCIVMIGVYQRAICMHRWAVEQLNGVMAMSKEVSGTRSDTLQFLALHAFFTVDPAAAKVHLCLLSCLAASTVQ